MKIHMKTVYKKYVCLSGWCEAWLTSFLGTGLGLALAAAAVLSSCTQTEAPLGSEDNPIKLFFVPSVEAKTLEDNSKIFEKYLRQTTPYHYKVSIPMNYITVVEAFGTSRADVAALNPFGYVLAHKRHGAEAHMTVLRNGLADYRAQIVVHADSGIKTLEDLQKKQFAFVDPASTSGFLMPQKLFKSKGIVLGNTVFAKKHDNVISMVYRKQVDAGATFYSPPDGDKIQDARMLVLTQYPDVAEKVRILALTDPIPNDPIVFRKGLDPKIRETIIKGFEDFLASEEGAKSFKALYSVTGLKRATDADYEDVRNMIEEFGKVEGMSK